MPEARYLGIFEYVRPNMSRWYLPLNRGPVSPLNETLWPLVFLPLDLLRLVSLAVFLARCAPPFFLFFLRDCLSRLWSWPNSVLSS